MKQTFTITGVRYVLMMAVAVMLGVAGLSSPAHAALKIDITRGNVDPLPVALPAFNGSGPKDARYGADIASVVQADLLRSGLFRVIPQSAFVQDPRKISGAPRFGDWRLIDAQALVTGTAQMQVDGRLKVEFHLWDTYAENQVVGMAYVTEPQHWRRIAHLIADSIYERLTGEKGYFDTRIVYIAESGPKNRRVKRLAIMDQDGANNRYLTHGQHLVLTPRFSPSTQEITYLSYFRNRPRVYIFNIETGQQEILGDFPGMSFAPRFSPDGNKVIMSMSRGGNTDVYTMDLRSRRLERLSSHPGIDTSPSFAPDGQQVVFNSDRGGSQQLYVMNANGSGVRRISFGDGRYATPVWSPRGDLIAFTKMKKGKFYIGVMRPDGSGERLLTESFLDEGPTWSPNGRVLMFFRQSPSDRYGRSGQTHIYSIDLTGRNERRVPTPGEASDPAWSPLISQRR